MRRSTRGSVSTELATSSPPIGWSLRAPSGRQLTFAAVAATPSGIAGLTLTGITIGVAVVGPFLSSADPFALSASVLGPPSIAHPMGTDALGRDLLSGVLHGARASLLVALLVCLLAFTVGLVIGMTAGFRGGVADDLLMRVTEIFQVLPRFFLAIVAVGLFGPGLDRVVLTLGLTSWPVVARVVRGEVVATRELDFVLAARATGAPPSRIIWRELLPHVFPSAAVMLGLLFAQVLLIEASLGFFGLGDPNVLSWGVLAGQASGFLRVAWWLPFFPGLAITTAVLGFNLLADSFSAALGRR